MFDMERRKTLQIFSLDEKHEDKFVLGSEISDFLLQDDIKNRRIVVVSICGAVGTGKSFILNYFLRYLEANYVQLDSANWLGHPDDPLTGFEWRGDLDPVTLGMYIWSKVFLHESPSGEKYAILLIDTQGIIGIESTLAQDLTVLATSSLLSSTLIYNAYRNINMADLEQFQVLADFLKDKGYYGDDAPFSNILVLIRDFPITKEMYGLQNLKNITNKTQLASLRSLEKLFKNVQCFSMCYPKCNFEQSEHFNGSIGLLNPKFLELLEQLLRIILAPEVIETGEWFSVEQLIDGFEQITKEVESYVSHVKASKAMADSQNLYVKEMLRSLEAAGTSKSPKPSKRSHNWNPIRFFNWL